MNKEVDYKQIVSDLNEVLIGKHWNEGWTFSREHTEYMDYIKFNAEFLWDSENESYDHKNDCDWTTKTLLEHCKEQFKQYIKLLNTIEIK